MICLKTYEHNFSWQMVEFSTSLENGKFVKQLHLFLAMETHIKFAQVQNVKASHRNIETYIPGGSHSACIGADSQFYNTAF